MPLDQTQNLHNQLSEMEAYLNKEPLLSFSQEARADLLKNIKELLAKIDILDKEVLTIGLLGGTGVGKSSLMNALAQKRISTSSHKRPHTDQVIIYRHQALPLPSAIKTISSPYREIHHQAETIRHILLCDLPDFDSLLGQHLDQVIDFLQHLDILIWVTSLEKYGDFRFYEFLSSVPKSGQNYYFVLNKVDKCFSTGSIDQGLDHLAKIKDQLSHYIAEALESKASPEDIPLFCLAASEAFSPDPISNWNQLDSFRQVVFKHRDEKEIARIKEDNLDVEVQNISRILRNEIDQIQSCYKTLDNLAQNLEKEHKKWRESGAYIFDLWVKESLFPNLVFEQADLKALIGPGYLVGLIIQEVKKRKKSPDGNSQENYPMLTDNQGTALKNMIAQIENRLMSELIRYNIPTSIREQVQRQVSKTEIWPKLEEEINSTISLTLNQCRTPKYRLFRFKQGASYSILILIALLAFGGQKAWLNLINDFNLKNCLHWFFSLAHSIFSPIGLAGLISLAIIASLLGIRSYFRYERLIYQSSNRVIQSLKNRLSDLWEAALDGVEKDLKEIQTELQDREKQLLSIQRD